MFKTCLLSTVSMLALLTSAGQGSAQTQFAVAGDFLGMLRDEVAWNILPLEAAKLRSIISGHDLTVIVFPLTQADPANPSIFVCSRTKTDLVLQPVTAADLQRLNEFATDTVYQLILDIQTSVAAQPAGSALTDEAKMKVAEVQKRLEKMPEARKKAASFLLGARMADLEPKQPELAGFVNAFRKEAEARAIGSLRPPQKEDHGKPQVFGPSGVTPGALNSIKDVEEIRVDGQRYHKAWAGGSLILVPQAKDAPSPQVNDPPLKKLGMHEDVHKQISNARPNHVILKGSSLHK